MIGLTARQIRFNASYQQSRRLSRCLEIRAPRISLIGSASRMLYFQHLSFSDTARKNDYVHPTASDTDSWPAGFPFTALPVDYNAKRRYFSDRRQSAYIPRAKDSPVRPGLAFLDLQPFPSFLTPLTSHRYSQRQLYALVADVDAYRRFIPFVTTSDVFEHKGRGEIKDKAWLDDQGEEGEKHVLRHLMKIQVMGFDEQWRSEVTCEKWYKVQVSSL